MTKLNLMKKLESQPLINGYRARIFSSSYLPDLWFWMKDE